MEVPECPGCRERDARIAALEARILALEAQVRDLIDKLKPPAARAQTPQPPAPAKKPTGKKPGAQPGHPPQMKTLAPPERVDRVVAYVPQVCMKCDQPLPAKAGAEDPEPKRHQVAELPPVMVQITEHQAHGRTCPCCGEVTWATIPAEVRAYSVGPKFTGFMGLLAGVHGVSKRGIEELMEQAFDVSIALGTVSNREQELSEALRPAHEEARQAIASADVKHADETGWKEAGKKRWLWVAAIQSVAYFVIHPCRNLSALKRLVGETFHGILCSDRWCVYDEWPSGRRQLCWAHLKRNWESQVERGGAAKRVGEAWLSLQGQVFELWHRFKAKQCTRRELGDQMAPLMLAMLEVLWSGRRSRDRVLVRFCERLAESYGDAWTFVVKEGVEPTNNHAERVLRRAVLWRRRSFGCHSADGCRFVERILTVTQTLRQQKRSVLTFLSEAIQAHRAGTTAPRLVIG
ncbi:MAG: IS66 family transposase [Pirellulales bacterium]